MKAKFTAVLLLSNHYGVLNRVTGLYAKRGYNINALSVRETADKNFSEMVIVSVGGEYEKQQIIRNIRKLHDVKHAEIFDKEMSLDEASKYLHTLKI